MRLFREIMSACLAQEEPLKVAYLGPEGTFTQRRCSSTSATRCTRCRCHDRRGVPRGRRRAPPTSASCRSRTRAKARSTSTRSTCSSRRRSRSAAKSSCAIHQHLMGSMHELERRSGASARIRSRSRSAAGGSRSTCRTSSACPVEQQRRSRAPRARRGWHGRASPATAAAEVYGLNILFARDRGPRRTTRRASSSSAASCSRRAATTRRRCWCRPRDTEAPGALLAPARAARAARRQHDPDRVAAVAPAQMGLRVLHRPRRPCRRRRPWPRRSPRSRAQASLFRVLGSYPEGRALT